MSSVQIKDKAENTAPAGDEWLFAQDPSDPFTVKKMSINTIGDYITDYAGFTPEVVGASIKTYSKLIPISASFPWFCLSYPDVDFTTANYSTEFIDELRSRKYVYDEFGTNTSAFSGSWTSANIFTLDSNTANNAMLAELAEDWLYHGSPVSNWRILSDGITEFNITGINVTARTITVDLDGKSTTGTSIIIYTNRVYRQATQARHFSEAGLSTYQAGGGKSGRLFRRDQMQRLTGSLPEALNNGIPDRYGYAYTNRTGVFMPSVTRGTGLSVPTGSTDGIGINFDSASSPDARTSVTTDGETRAKSSSRYEYIYVGSYKA